MKKRMMTLILTGAMLATSLAGCGGTNGTTQQENKISGSGTAASQAEVQVQVPAEGGRDVGGLMLPLTTEKEDLSVWLTYNSSTVKDINEIKGIQQMEENTNVHVNWTPVTLQEVQEKLGIMLSSGTFPDIVYAGSYGYPGGISKGVEDGVIADMDPLIRENMPNYMTIVNTNEEARKEAATDDGKMNAVKIMVGTDTTIESEGTYTGMAYRQDMMEKLGYDVPATVEGWHKVLLQAKEDGVEIPFEPEANGGSYFSLAYGVTTSAQRAYMQVDGNKVVYAPLQDGFGAYLDEMQKWYAEGLIDPNFTSFNMMANPDYVENDRALLFASISSGATGKGLLGYGMVTKDSVYLQPLGQPVLNENDAPIQCFRRIIAKDPIYITTSCKNPELAAKWLDYQFSDEGCFLNWYGTEGETWEYGEDGTPQFLDSVYNNPEGLPVMDYLQKFALNQGWCWLGKHDIECGWKQAMGNGGVNYSLEAQKIWSEPETNIYMTESLEFTDDEGVQITQLQTALSTMVDEYMVNYILGRNTEDFETFREGLKNYGADQLTQIYQDAYDRYLAR